MAKKYSTPGVYREEIDQSNILQPAGTSTGAVVVRAIKGPVNKPVLVNSDKDLIDTFGAPVFTSGQNGSPDIPDYGYGMYAALEFLSESNRLYVGRVCDTTDKYSALYLDTTGYDYTNTSAITDNICTSAGIAAIPFELGNQFDTGDYISSIETSANLGVSGTANSNVVIAALYPGLDGDNIAVSIETATSGCDWLYKYDDTSTSALSAFSLANQNLPIASKVARVDVYLKATSQSWTTIKANVSSLQLDSATSALSLRDIVSPVETFYGTFADQLDANGNQLNLKTIVNGVSKYIYVKTAQNISNLCLTSPNAFSKLQNFNLLTLGGGAISTSATATGMGSDVLSTWDLFASREKLAGVNILINADWDTGVKQKVAGIAASRMDCIAVGQAGDIGDSVVSDILDQERFGYSNPSYMALYAGFDKVRDTFNSKWLWLPKAAFAASIMARTDNVANTWDAPAGTTRGIIPSYAQKVIFTKAQIGSLYDRNINTSLIVPGTGAVLWGQKTAQLKATALDRINVRRLLIYLENSIEPMLQDFLFALNTPKVQQRVSSLVSSFLGDVMAAGGLTGYRVVCDTSNNTPNIINNNQLLVDIYVQPSKTIEFITLRTIIQNSGVSIVEISQ